MFLENYTMLSKERKLSKKLKDLIDSRKHLHKLGQANKGKGWMPWHQKPKKDVVSCEKSREAASKR
jgi:hypothetical protein